LNTETSISIGNINYTEDKISYTINNETDSNIYYGAEIIIEKLIDGNWYLVPMLENVGFDSILYNLSSKSDIIEDIPLSLWDTMSFGQYRLIKRFSQDENYKDTKYLIGEFLIMD
ncbi:MAG: hypothetical protein KGZ96_07265, partial [Clostridia bacterium]|nr:hypothetical protein [Clostridia bacterium]